MTEPAMSEEPKPTTGPDTLKKINLAIAELDRKYKQKGLVVRLGNDNVQDIPTIPTGALVLDQAIGAGGYPVGRVTEIYGPESSGKSTLALCATAQAQAMGMTVLYVDMEQAIDPVYAKKLGVNMDDLLMSQPDYGEQAFDIIEHMIKTQTIDLIVVDSVAALTPEAELRAEMADKQMGELARLMSKGMRKINPLLNKDDTQTAIIFINQLRTNIGGYGNPEVTPGGKALKYAASVRIDLRKTKKGDSVDITNSNGDVIGSHVRAKIIKNKVGPPLRVADFDILYGEGIDSVGCIVDMAIEKEIWKKSGAWYYDHEGENYAQGRTNAINRLKEEPETLALVEELVREEL